ncbi:helix-turn-helix domain-containing protein [Halomicrobium urmianum]|uniref:helix-turn-helix domain-containing protein n=1 Tax=Halomicrobium urmianum TaxID=1586233 RepID=UPI001CD964AF|nr:helix-turn-helix domain-containing protein [Halomicrobium urmianum]
MDDEIFEALADQHRRDVLVALLAEDRVRPASVCADAGEDGESEARRAMLHHCHLPMLADAEFVEWDREADTVRQGDAYSKLRPILGFIVTKGAVER